MEVNNSKSNNFLIYINLSSPAEAIISLVVLISIAVIDNLCA
jgi:hypothetical protein